MRSALPATYAMATAGSILAMPTTVRERWTARRAAASYGRRARTCAIPPTRRSPSVCRRPALCISKACRARACGRTGPATRRRSRAISSATSTNPRMTLRGERSATSRSSARASRQLTPASLRRQPRPLFCRPAPPRRRRSSPAHRVRRPRLLARRLQNPRGRRRQLRPGRRLAASIACSPDQVRRVSTGACEPSCPRPGIQIGGKCCVVGELAAGGACSNSSCPAGETAIGPSNFCCNSSQVYFGPGGVQACCAGPLVNGQCLPPTTSNCPPGSSTAGCPICAAGYVPAGGSCCLASKVTSTGACCPAGEAPGPDQKTCEPIFHVPVGPLCCASGLIPTASGACCSPANVTTTGQCCLQPVNCRGSVRVPGVDPGHQGVRRRLCPDGGRDMLQQSVRQRRRAPVHRRLAAVRARRDPRPARRLCSDPRRAGPAACDQDARVPAWRGAHP